MHCKLESLRRDFFSIPLPTKCKQSLRPPPDKSLHSSNPYTTPRLILLSSHIPPAFASHMHTHSATTSDHSPHDSWYDVHKVMAELGR